MKYRGIALRGRGRVGKSTAAKYLQGTYALVPLHIKNLLGEMIAPLLLRLGIPAEELADRIFGSKIDDSIPGYPDLTCRKLLQAQGNGFLLELPDPLIMNHLLLGSVPPSVPVVIESVRHEREVPWLKERGFYIVGLRRNVGDELDQDHVSENDPDFSICNAVIDNDRSLSELADYLDELVRGIFPRPRRNRGALLVIVNGRPRSGKDTLVNAMAAYAKARYDEEVVIYSSIDPIRELLDYTGRNVSAKTEKDRNDLCMLGQIFFDFRVRKTLESIRDVLSRDGTAFVFARENETIAALQHAASLRNTPAKTIWVSRPGFEQEGTNPSDNISMQTYDYDFSVVNQDGIKELEVLAGKLFDCLHDQDTGGFSTITD